MWMCLATVEALCQPPRLAVEARHLSVGSLSRILRHIVVALQRGRGVLQRNPVLLDGLQHDLAVVLQRGGIAVQRKPFLLDGLQHVRHCFVHLFGDLRIANRRSASFADALSLLSDGPSRTNLHDELAEGSVVARDDDSESARLGDARIAFPTAPRPLHSR